MRRRRIIIWFLVILLALLLLPFVFLTFEHFRGKIGLAHYKKELRAKGVKLTPQELEALRPTGENGAPALLAAVNQINSNVALFTNSPISMRLLPSGRAIVGFRETEWSEEGATRPERVTNNWDNVAGDLETSAATLRLIRELLKKPVLDNHLDLSLAPNAPIHHLAKMKSLGKYLGAAMQLALQDARRRDVVDNLTAEIQVSRSLDEDRTAISGLVGYALAAIAMTYTWEAMQADGWSDDELGGIQATWARQDFLRTLLQSLEGEFVFSEVYAESLRHSNQAAFDTIYGMQLFLDSDEDQPWWQRTLKLLPGGEAAATFLQQQVYCRIWRFAWLDQCELRTLRDIHALVETAGKAANDKSLASVQSSIDDHYLAAADKGFYDALRYPIPSVLSSLNRMIVKALAAQSMGSLALSAVAIKRYTLKYGKPPPTLDALVPEFLAAVPTDYMDGKPIKYRLNSDGSFALYSVGEDGKDDGGDGSLPAKNDESVASRKRKDYLWPMPATPAELEEYRRKQEIR